MSEQTEHCEYCQNKDFKERSKKLQGWFDSPVRSTLLKAEQRCIDHSLRNIFGYHACQVSVASHLNLLNNCRVNHRFKLVFDVDYHRSAIQCDPYFWSVESGSLDVVLLHHVLEVAESPHRLLSQAADSIIPDGKLLIIGFNPWSMSSLSRWLVPERGKVFQGIRFIQISRLRDWLTLLGFSIEHISYGAYINSLEWLFKGISGGCIEQRCEQWQLPFGGFYSILATKEVHGVTLIRKPWLKVRNHLVGQPVVRSVISRR